MQHRQSRTQDKVALHSPSLEREIDAAHTVKDPGRGGIALAITGTNINRISRYSLQATFTLPSTPGMLDATAIFPGPNRPTFGLTNAFEVAP